MRALLQPLMLVEEWFLNALHAVGLTWGFAIVGLTLLVRLGLVPLAVRQAGARRRCLAHAPELKELRTRHGHDRAALRAELAAYRRRHGLGIRGVVVGVLFQLLVIWSLALLLRSDAAEGTFGDASWLFVPDLSEPAAGGTLALLLGTWLAIRLAALRLAARVGPLRIAITLLAPIPLVLAAPHLPAGLWIYLVVSAAFGLAQKLALRTPQPRAVAAPA